MSADTCDACGAVNADNTIKTLRGGTHRFCDACLNARCARCAELLGASVFVDCCDRCVEAMARADAIAAEVRS